MELARTMLDNVETHRPYITTPQAAKRSGLSKNYLATLLRKGKLEGFQLARDWFVYTDSLERFLAANRKPGPKGPRKKPIQEQLTKTPTDSSDGTGTGQRQ
jgi:hypothetical protein